MKEIQVQFAARFIERQWSTAIGKSLLKTLTEPITNSDDSYRRIVESDPTLNNSQFPITISIDRKRRVVRVIDEAQGMKLSELENKFEEYGAAKSGAYEGFSTRGLFGQGISDVLFYHKNGKIQSIKNGEASVCSFYKKGGKPYIRVAAYDGSAEDAAKEWGISGKHGTSIEFTVDGDTPIHDFENLVKKLRVFYMLRLINANDKRKIIVTYKDNKGIKTSEVKYSFPQGDLIDHRDFTFDLDGYSPIRVDVELYKSNDSLSTTDEEREVGLLVFDDKQAVYDQTFFGLENLRGADKYFGTMKLTGAREIILEKINDSKHPEAILTDSRDGFDKQNIFYKKLAIRVKDWLYPILNEESRKRTDEGISENTKDKHRKALDELNKLYVELAGEKSNGTILKKQKNRPIGGIEFARSAISVTSGKQYGLQVYIDTNVIPVGSKVILNTKKWKVSYSPKVITVMDAPKGKEGMFVKTLLIRGNEVGSVDVLEANWEKHHADVVISIVDQEIVYPDKGIVFSPDYIRTTHGRENYAKLFVDTSKIEPNSVVSLTSSNASIQLKQNSIEVKKTSSGNIETYDVPFIGIEDNQTGVIEALCGEFACQCKVDIKDRVPYVPPSHSGKFKDWTFDDNLPRIRQTTYDDIPGSPTQGYILVSTTHPLNRKYFGDTPTKTTVESSRVSQLYLAELILNESLGAIVAEVYQKGYIPSNYGPAIDIPEYIAQKKYELGARVYGYFVDDIANARDAKLAKRLEEVAQERQTTEIQLIENLEDRSRQMVEMYFGLNEHRPHTLEEIGNKFSITRERVRQIVNKALAPKDSYLNSKDKKDDTTDYLLEQENKIKSSINEVLSVTSNIYGLKGSSEIKKKTRRAEIAIPRQVSMFVLHTNIGLSFSSIARVFNMDHTTVMHGANKIKEVLGKDVEISKKVAKIQKQINTVSYFSVKN